nr:MAG TPA: hypothetical protein [Caudoviricetes sp.]
MEAAAIPAAAKLHNCIYFVTSRNCSAPCRY